MANEYSKPVNRLVDAFRKLPGVGPRTARRMTWHIVESSYDEVVELARALVQVKKNITPCSECYNYTDTDPCGICSDEKRDKSFVCVVESPEDVAALERAGGHKGVYHVLGGAINPAAGLGPENVRAKELYQRAAKGEIKEVLIATNPSVQGEITAMYLSKLLSPLNVRITRPAMGMPAGSDIDFLDNDTLTQAFHGRRDFSHGDEKTSRQKNTEKSG